jgi:very-short-patch-repair endonuclease
VNPILLERAREMRKTRFPAEAILWSVLRDRQLDGLKFRRQHSIDKYIADFYCAEFKLVVESDGDTHDGREKYDETRTQRLKELGYQVVRYTNTDVFENLEGVLISILDICRPADGPSS